MPKLSIIIFGCLLLCSNPHCHGQTDIKTLLSKLRAVNTGKVIGYDYSIYLVDIKKNRRIDSMKGMMYKEGNSYVDSNTHFLSAMNGSYYCKMDHLAKMATVYDVKYLQTKLKLSLEDQQAIINIPDSLIEKYAQIKIVNGSSTTQIATIHFTGYKFSDLRIEYQKADYKILSIIFETEEDNDDPGAYKRIYVLKKIRLLPIEGMLKLDRMFKIAGNKVVVNNKYSSYQLRTLNP